MIHKLAPDLAEEFGSDAEVGSDVFLRNVLLERWVL